MTFSRSGRWACALVVGAVVAACVPACSQDTAPSDPDTVEISGTVQFLSIEGGVWTIAGDDGVTYEPHDTLPVRFRASGARIRATARLLPNAICIHMAGRIIEITRIG